MKNNHKKYRGSAPAKHPMFALAARILKAAGSREAYEVCVFGSAAKGDVEKASQVPSLKAVACFNAAESRVKQEARQCITSQCAPLPEAVVSRCT